MIIKKVRAIKKNNGYIYLFTCKNIHEKTFHWVSTRFTADNLASSMNPIDLYIHLKDKGQLKLLRSGYGVKEALTEATEALPKSIPQQEPKGPPASREWVDNFLQERLDEWEKQSSRLNWYRKSV